MLLWHLEDTYTSCTITCVRPDINLVGASCGTSSQDHSYNSLSAHLLRLIYLLEYFKWKMLIIWVSGLKSSKKKKKNGIRALWKACRLESQDSECVRDPVSPTLPTHVFVECCKTLLIKQFTVFWAELVDISPKEQLLQLKKSSAVFINCLSGHVYEESWVQPLALDWIFKGFVVIIGTSVANGPARIARHNLRFAASARLDGMIRLFWLRGQIKLKLFCGGRAYERVIMKNKEIRCFTPGKKSIVFYIEVKSRYFRLKDNPFKLRISIS